MNITRWLMAVTLLSASLFSSSVFAFSSTPAGNVTTFGAFTPSPANLSNYTLSTASDGSVLLKGGPRMQVPGGGSIPLNVTGAVPRSTVAAAVGRFVVKVGPLGYALNTAAALYVLGQELGFTLDNATGTLVVQKQGSATDLWQVNTSAGVTFQCRVSSMDQVCACAGLTWAGAPNYCMPGYRVPVKIAGTSQPGALQPSTVQAFQDAIAADTSWPTTSVLGTVLRESILAGENISVAPQTVTGPATSPGPVTQTVDNVNNTTTTSTTTHNHTYSGPSVTTTSTTTNITIDNSTGNVINSTTSTTQPVMPETDAEEGSPIDKALPGLPQLYQPKYPDGLVGVWNDKKSQLDSAPLVALVGDLMPSVAATGACPTWTINMNLGVWDYGIFDLSPPCWLWDFARAVIIACALLLSRRLVFGG